MDFLTLKKLGWINLTLPVVFAKAYFLKRVKPLFIVTFNIILGHIFPENFIKISKDMRSFSVNISYFHQFIGFFDISLL